MVIKISNKEYQRLKGRKAKAGFLGKIAGKKASNYLIGGALLTMVNKFAPTQILGDFRLAGNMALVGLIPKLGQKSLLDAGLTIGVSTAINKYVWPRVAGRVPQLGSAQAATEVVGGRINAAVFTQ